MSNPPDLAASAAITTSRPTPTPVPRIRILPQGFAIDHPDPDLGERLMADALGVADRDAMDGILRQLVRASASGDGIDETSLSFMIAMVKSIGPRDSIEAMLVAQMVSVHVMAMRCAQQLAAAGDIVQRDSAARALGRLARTFPAQIEALTRHRSRGEPAITVQNVSVGDGGKAIVGNITQHRSVIVSDAKQSSTTRETRKAARARRRRDRADARREAAQMEASG